MWMTAFLQHRLVQPQEQQGLLLPHPLQQLPGSAAIRLVVLSCLRLTAADTSRQQLSQVEHQHSYLGLRQVLGANVFAQHSRYWVSLIKTLQVYMSSFATACPLSPPLCTDQIKQQHCMPATTVNSCAQLYQSETLTYWLSQSKAFHQAQHCIQLHRCNPIILVPYLLVIDKHLALNWRISLDITFERYRGCVGGVYADSVAVVVHLQFALFSRS